MLAAKAPGVYRHISQNKFMIIQKKVSVGADFAKIKEDIVDGDVIKINDGGQPFEGSFGTQTVFKVETKNGEKAMSFNQTSLNNLVDAYGQDTIGWIGKEAKVWLIKMSVQGKMRDVVFLAEPTWVMGDDGLEAPAL